MTAVAALLLAVGAAPAVAQQAAAATAPMQSVQAGAVDYAIPPSELTDALVAFGEQSGLQVLYPADLARGLRSPGVSGRLAPEEALRRLLAGSGLGYRYSGPSTVTLGRAGEAGGDGAALLGPVTVEGNRESPWGPVEGYVAHRTITGTKTDTPLIEVPQSISVVTREQMEARNVQEDSEIFLYTPGVYAQPYGGTLSQFNPYLQIRGFSNALGGSFLDGLTFPTNYRSEPYGLERAEVLRGPTSVLYGQSDPGGLVNRISKRPPEQELGEVRFGLGSYERVEGAVDLGGPLDEEGQFLYRLTGLTRFGNAAVDYDFDQEIPNERQFLAPAFTWRPSDRTSLTLLGSYLKDDAGQEVSYKREDYSLTHIRLDQPGADDFDYRHYTVGYAFEHAFDDGFTVRQNLRYSDFDYSYVSMAQDSLEPDGRTLNRTVFGFGSRRDGIFVDTHAQKDLTTGPLEHRLLAGIDFQRTHDRTDFSWGLAPSLDLLDPDYDQAIPAPEVYQDVTTNDRGVGLYLQDQMKIYEDWVLTFGGRKDWYRSEATDELFGGATEQSGDAFTYRAGLTWLAPFGLAPYASYAESFLPNSGVDFEGDLFEPTRGRQYEVGLKYQPSSLDAEFTLALFDLAKQNVPTADPDHLGFSVQTGEIRNRGLELEAVAELRPGLSLVAAYSYIDGEITQSNDGTEGNRPSLVPEHLASLWADYRIAEGALSGFGLGAGVRYVGSTFADNANTIENASYVLFDLAARYELGEVDRRLQGAEVAVNVTNLFDTGYQSCYSRFDCAWGAPRTVMGTVTYRW